MSWTTEEWKQFIAILQYGFAAREPFSADEADVYRLLLEGVEPAAAVAAVKELVASGQALRPRPGEIMDRITADPSAPTFAEAYALLYGPRGALRVPPVRGAFPTPAAMDAAQEAAMRERAAQLHPLLGSFIERQGLGRLRSLPLDDPQWGFKHRADLERDWQEHVEAMEGREVAALASGAGRSGLRQLDPLAALGVSAEERAQITNGGVE